MVTAFTKLLCYIHLMPFIPTEKQVSSLHFLLKQLIRERVEIRLIRFNNWTHPTDVKNCDVEILCLEDEDRYKIYYDGTIIEGKNWRY
ncbi:MAG: hypothetical protein HY094_08660 [Candidatus Melainabacteria bacterium]|nr:hypothetical protein [Candidatus Melainabacteria bacterium]